MTYTVHIHVPIQIEDIPYSESVVRAMKVIDTGSSFWTNLLNEIERIQPDGEENPTQKPFVCECGATVVWKAWRHDDGVYCDVCGRYYAVEGIDAVTHCMTLENGDEVTTIYKHKTYAKNESEITRGLEAYRNPNGSVEIRITAEDEWHDPVSLSKTLLAEDATKLGRALLCIEDRTFDGLIERAAKFGDDCDE